MKLKYIILSVLLTGCNTQKCITQLQENKRLNDLRTENSKLRTEIDHLKNKLSNIRKLYELDTLLNEKNYEK